MNGSNSIRVNVIGVAFDIEEGEAMPILWDVVSLKCHSVRKINSELAIKYTRWTGRLYLT